MNTRHVMARAACCLMIGGGFGFSDLVLAQSLDIQVNNASKAAPDLLLAKELPPHVRVADYLVSEKYDGVRAFWDGRILRFRGGGVVPAPKWFTAALPTESLDGELWTGRGQFERTSGIVRQTVANDADWRLVRYMVFELPNAQGSFVERAQAIRAIVDKVHQPQLQAVEQFYLTDRVALQKKLDDIVRAGGEGVMLHLASAPYETGRSDVLYKLKPRQDAEAVVVSHIAGQGKFAGMLGAIRVRTDDGREFNIGSGFSDEQRRLPPAIGSTVTYQYLGLTKNGLPRFAHFLRMRVNL